MKILIIKPSSLGDIVQALPVLRSLKAYLPESDIYWWVTEAFAPLLHDDPDLSGVYIFPRKSWLKPSKLRETHATVRRIQQMCFDLVIDLQGLLRSGIATWLANGNRSVGIDLKIEGARAFYDCVVSRPIDRRHAVDWYLEVLRCLGVPPRPDLNWLPLADAKLEPNLAGNFNATADPLVAVIPGARWENKRWPAEHFATTCQQILAIHPNSHFIVLGTHEDSTAAARIIRMVTGRGHDLTGQTSLSELIDWLRRCRLVITNDTGPMHIAAALGKPVLALFGPTRPDETGPYGQTENTISIPLDCAPCMKARCLANEQFECLQSLSSDSVTRRALGLLTVGQ